MYIVDKTLLNMLFRWVKSNLQYAVGGKGQLKCDGTRVETRFRLSAKLKSPFKSAWASVQSTIGSWDERISGSSAGYTMFRGSVKSTDYPLHSSVSPSLPVPTSPCAITFQLECTCQLTTSWFFILYWSCPSKTFEVATVLKNGTVLPVWQK